MQCIQKQKQTCDTGFKFASLFLHAWLARLWLLPACGFAYKKSKLVEKWEGGKEEELIGAILVFFSAGKKSTVFFFPCLKKKRQIFSLPLLPYVKIGVSLTKPTICYCLYVSERRETEAFQESLPHD